MIPTINLDDRTFDDIRNEAIRLIPRYCPEWTNHNPSDPGIALIELFSWMTEMTLYRLNKVPAKTYLSMLELMGLSLTAPQSARVPVRFFPVDGCRKPVFVKGGTKVASVSSEGQSIIFETESDLRVCENRIISCVNRNGEKWSEACSDDGIEPFHLFDSCNSVEHTLYIMSPLFKYLRDGHGVQVSFEPVSEILSVNDEIINHIFWEYWDGRVWMPMETAPSMQGIKKQDDVVYLAGPADIQPCVVDGKEGLFVRAVLSDVPENINAVSVKGLRLRTIFEGDGFAPDLCISNSNAMYAVVDMNSSFRLFSEIPTFNEMFYISADEILKNKSAKAKITYAFSEVYVPDAENDSALFSYEYWNGKDWGMLDPERNEFLDGTFGFKQGGTVSFKIPKDISKTFVDNEEHYWIRVRLVTKDFSIGGTYIQDDAGNWGWQFNSKVQSPLISKIRIAYNAQKQRPESVISCSNFKWIDHNVLCGSSKRQGEIVLFNIEKDALPTLYLGFSDGLPEGDFPLYFKIDESAGMKNQSYNDLLQGFPGIKEERKSRFFSVAWEYWNGTCWNSIDVTDGTDSFHDSGFITFIIPHDAASCVLFNKECHWIRVVKLFGSFENVPVIESILMNVVYARNEDSYKNEIIGSGTGAPCQSFHVSHPTLLPGLELYVDEGSVPSDNELRMMASDGITIPYYKEKDHVWVKYKEVPNFYSSDAFSRHFVIDYSNGQIQFGDGIHGVNPPKGKFNIKAASYKVGGGATGNIAAHKIQFITQSIPYIAGCDNPFAAEGGADMETVEDLKSRAAGVFKSLNRAVTAEDFQWLSREASASVGRSFCLKDMNLRGEICTLVIPKMDADTSIQTKLVPSRELIRKVGDYLDERKLVGTVVRVSAPVYRDFDIRLSLVFKTNVFDYEGEKRKIEEQLYRYFHALYGGEGDGWEFGKYVTVGAVLKQLEKSSSILSVNETELFDREAGVNVEKLILKPDELPYLNSVAISERRVS